MKLTYFQVMRKNLVGKKELKKKKRKVLKTYQKSMPTQSKRMR